MGTDCASLRQVRHECGHGANSTQTAYTSTL